MSSKSASLTGTRGAFARTRGECVDLSSRISRRRVIPAVSIVRAPRSASSSFRNVRPRYAILKKDNVGIDLKANCKFRGRFPECE